MNKIWLLIIILFVISPATGKQDEIQVVLIGTSHAFNCEFHQEDNFALLNHSVADFTSGQLLWTLEHGVIAHSPEICIIQTGSLDILLGIPKEKVLENLNIFYERLTEAGIKMAIIEDFPYWSETELMQSSEDLNMEIMNFADENGIKYISLKDSDIHTSAINPGGKPILTDSGCVKFQSLILKAIENE